MLQKEQMQLGHGEWLRANFRRGRRCVCAVAALACALWLPTNALGEPFVNLGPSDGFGIALGQPIVSVHVYRDAAGTQSFGPTGDLQYMVLDTGSNGLVFDGNAYADLAPRGYQTEAVYDEQGVAGFTPMDVSAAYRLDVRPALGPTVTIQNARIMSNPEIDFGSIAGFFGLVGMPAMAGRTVTLDLAGEWTFPGSGEFGGAALTPPVIFSAAPPPSNGHRYHIPLSMREFPQSGQRNPLDPLPTWAPLSFAPVELRHGGNVFQGEMLVDTGAQMSILSTETAIALGLDENGNGSLDDEAIDFFPIGGIGGTVLMPVLFVQSGAVKTDEGVDLRWTDLTVGILDIDPSIDGLFGMNFFTEGWTEKFYADLFCELFGECDPTVPDGDLEQVHFDFRDYQNLRGTLVFDVRPELDVVQVFQAGDLNGDQTVDAADLSLFTLALTNPAAYDALYPDIDRQFVADIDGDGRVSNLDLDAIASLLSTGALQNVPEPATGTLALLAGVWLAGVGLHKCWTLRSKRCLLRPHSGFRIATRSSAAPAATASCSRCLSLARSFANSFPESLFGQAFALLNALSGTIQQSVKAGGTPEHKPL